MIVREDILDYSVTENMALNSGKVEKVEITNPVKMCHIPFYNVKQNFV